MRFLIDAQLPRRLALWFQQRGHDVIHTFDLVEKNRTPDLSLLALANKEHRQQMAAQQESGTWTLREDYGSLFEAGSGYDFFSKQLSAS